ncbi:hypothetical protein LCGC14_2372070, partial [marine sediment metagenome]
FSQAAVSLESGGVAIPSGSILPTMLSTLVMDGIVTFDGVLVSHEGDTVYKV